VPTFAVRNIHHTGWDHQRPLRQQDAWTEHASFMNTLVADGFGGHTGGHGVLLIVEAASEDEIYTRLRADPWAQRGLLAIETIEPWTILLDSREDH
jgi:hypothetical protein